MVKIVLSKTARFDLKEIVDYIKRDSIKYAVLEKKKIIESINKLPKQALSGKGCTGVKQRKPTGSDFQKLQDNL